MPFWRGHEQKQVTVLLKTLKKSLAGFVHGVVFNA